MAKTNYDSQFCGSLPLAFINQVQPYGFLIVTDKFFKVLQVSDNTLSHIGKAADEIIELPLKSIIDRSSWENFETKISNVASKKFTIMMDIKTTESEGISVLAIVHPNPDYFIFEFEKTGEKNTSFLEVYQHIREVSSSIQNAEDFQTALSITTRELKKFSGFDKVMIYKFDQEWNGHVVAEEMAEGMESYLGLHFPASDIPRQARELYLKNPFRQIPDREYVPSKIIPLINPVTAGFIDLSNCNLRAVAKVHLEYLKNMNVVSSMSTRIIKDNRLWGLISCHHRTAKFLSYDDCSIFEMLSGIISSKLSSEEVKLHLDITSNQAKIHSKIAEDIYSENTLGKGIRKTYLNILRLLNCTGLAYSLDGNVTTFGLSPSNEIIDDLIIWLQTRSTNECYHTSNLSEEYDGGKTISEESSGLIALPIVPAKGEFIVGFRSETLQEIRWGGNPAEAINFEADKKTYHPRNSFSLWQENVKETSRPFDVHEINAAKDILRLVLAYKIAELKSN